MIDRHALQELAGRQLEAMQTPSGISLILHLHAGVFDREPEDRSTIGFHSQWTGKKPNA